MSVVFMGMKINNIRNMKL